MMLMVQILTDFDLVGVDNHWNPPVALLSYLLYLFDRCSIFLINYICPMEHAKEDLQVRWLKLRIFLKEKFAIKPDMDGILFLIGVQELGTGKQVYTKEQKQDLMHIAVCTVLAQSGYYVMEGLDEEGWPHFKQLIPLPAFNVFEQENFLKDHVLLYFEQIFKKDN
jgi:hypothetical protein